jgi:hypothetical protein
MPKVKEPTPETRVGRVAHLAYEPWDLYDPGPTTVTRSEYQRIHRNR